MSMVPRSLLVFLTFGSVICQVTSLAEECENPKDVGFECAEAGKQMRFYHDKITGVCQPMFYKGCGGNENRFESAKACREQCSQTAPQRTRKGKVIKQQPLMFKDICNATYSPNIVKPLDKCKLSDTCEANYSCHQGNCCPKKEYVCKLDYDSGKEAVENVHEPRYAYNSHLNTCGRFSYFRAEGNFNNFLSFGDCMKFCGVQ